MGNLKSTVRLRASRTDRVGDRGTPEERVARVGESTEPADVVHQEWADRCVKRVIPSIMWKEQLD